MTKCICGVEISPANVHYHQGCGTAIFHEERRDMTPEQEMQAIVEAVPGGCWHESSPGIKWNRCKHCGFWDNHLGSSDLLEYTANPSPTDLNALFELAGKLGATGIDFYHRGKVCNIYMDDNFPRGRSREEADTPADALRKTLYAAIKEV